MILGIDVSNNNGLIHWPLVAESGIGRAVIKSSEGTSFHDDYYAANVRGARDAGLRVEAYHFGRPSLNSGAAEAKYAAAIIKAGGEVDGYWLDLEDEDVSPYADLGAYALDFLETASELLGVRWGLYSSHGYLRDHKCESRCDLGTYKLWLASWQTVEPMSVLGWAAWEGWQFTDRGVTPGVGLVDQSLWKGWG